MPDVAVVLSRVRENLVAVSRRREELQRELDGLDREHERLAVAVEVMEHHAGHTAVPSSSDDSAAVPRLTERILDALVDGSARRRGDLVRLFQQQGVNRNTVGSAIRRLVQKGLVRREGRQLVVVSGSASAAGASGRDQRQADSALVAVESAPVANGGSSSDAGREVAVGGAELVSPPNPVDGFLTDRVHEVVAKSVATTRKALIRHFARQGVTESAVDNAIRGLRRTDRLGRKPNREYFAVGSDVPSADVEAVSRGS